MRTSTGLRPGLLAAVILAAIAAILIAASPARAATHQVSIQGLAFSPAAISVAVGDTVTWTNNDTVPHTASSTTAALFDSGNLVTGASFSFTFATPGTYSYRCNIHTEMTGSVVVSATAAGTIPSAGTTPAAPATGSGLTSSGPASGTSLLLSGALGATALAAAVGVAFATRRPR